jgi:hypothetical protein
VLISHDETSKPLPSNLFADDSEVHITAGRGGRGDFLIVDGYINALRYIRNNNIEYDWLINLSGSDYPVMSLRQMEIELERTQFDGFLHHFDVLRNVIEDMSPMVWPSSEGVDRYYFQYRKFKDRLSQAERNLVALPRIFAKKYTRKYRIYTAYGFMLGERARHHPFSNDFKCYAGSYWHGIRRKCADYLLAFTEDNPQVEKYFRAVLIPDESYIQTVLVNNSAFNFSRDNRRFFDMSGSRHGHPKLLTAEDLPSILGKGYFFARKFERSSGNEVFENLDHIARS